MTNDQNAVNRNINEGGPSSGQLQQEPQSQSDTVDIAQIGSQQGTINQVAVLEAEMKSVKLLAADNIKLMRELAGYVSSPMQEHVSKIMHQIARITDTIEHARHTLQGSANPSEAAMQTIGKIERIVLEIQGRDLSYLIAHCSSLSEITHGALNAALQANSHAASAASHAQSAYSTCPQGKAFNELAERLIQLETKAEDMHPLPDEPGEMNNGESLDDRETHVTQPA